MQRDAIVQCGELRGQRPAVPQRLRGVLPLKAADCRISR
jgi:hypothetical protein